LIFQAYCAQTRDQISFAEQIHLIKRFNEERDCLEEGTSFPRYTFKSHTMISNLVLGEAFNMLKNVPRKKSLMRSICMLLAVTMVVSMLVFNVSGYEDGNVASAITLPSGITAVPRGKISDLDTSNFTFSNTPDAIGGPSANTIANIFLNTPNNDGRIWTDKSVNAAQAFIYDSSGGVVEKVIAQPNEFLVTLSALSQSINTSEIIVEPSDTVFVIDVSGSMVTNSVPGDGRSRIAVVIDALNDAIVMLMGANPNNRISVVIYGGQSVSGQNQAKVYPVLTLGRYEIAGPIFSVSGSNVTVNSAVTNPLQRTFVAEGGTPTQLGIRRGADVLLGVPRGLAGGTGTQFDSGTADPANPGNNIIVTRKPNIILMTDGEPTYAWLDHTMSNFANFQGVTTSANMYDVGNGSAGDMGLTTLTVLTASYMKQLVRDWYYPTTSGTPGYSPDNATKSVGFYTLGLGVNTAIANAMLSPYGTSSGGAPNASLVTQVYPPTGTGQITYTMLNALNNFVNPAPPSSPPPPFNTGPFPYLNRGSSSARTLSPGIANANPNGFVASCSYDTMSFTAMDKQGLDDAFSQITQQIVTQGNYSTNVVNDSQYEGYLVFSDVIGEYMEFGEFVGLWYNNIQNDGTSFKDAVAPSGTSAITTAFIAELPKFLDNIDSTIAQNIVTSSRLGGELNRGVNGNKVVYYADQNRDFVGYVYDPITGALNTPPATAYAKVELYVVEGPALNALDGSSADLMLLVFQVVNVIQAGDFVNLFANPNTPYDLVSPLLPGDQIVRWYIPAALIPMRYVERVLNPDDTPQKDDFGYDVVQVSEAVPLRMIYSVVPDVAAIGGTKTSPPYRLTAQYMNVNKSPSPNGYYFYTNRWRGMDGFVQRTPASSPLRNDLANMSQSFFQPSNTNEFYKRVLTDSTFVKEPNVTGPTGTSPWQTRYTSFTYNPTTRVQMLGNNGRIELISQVPLYIEKYFNFAATGLTIEDLSLLTFTVIGLDDSDPAVGKEIFRAVIDFNDTTTFELIGTPAPGGYDYKLRVPMQVPPGYYNIYESGGIAFGYPRTTPNSTIYSRIPSPMSPQPPLTLINTYDNIPPTPGLYINKIFHGLSPADVYASLPNTFRIDLEFLNGTTWEVVESMGKSDFVPPPPYTPPPPATAFGYYIDGTSLSDGMYRIVEYFTDIGGFVLNATIIPSNPFSLTAAELSSPGVMILIDNVYERPTFSMDLTKIIRPSPLQLVDEYGNTVTRPPVDLAIKVEKTGTEDDPSGFLATYRYQDLIVNGSPVTIQIPNLRPGNYKVTELGTSVAGFNEPRVSLSLNDTSVTLVQTPTPPQPPPYTYSYTFLLDGNRVENNFSLEFTNRYEPSDPPPPPIEPPPPTPPPAPQTGVDRNIFIPIIMLSFGFLWIGGAEVYRRKAKK